MAAKGEAETPVCLDGEPGFDEGAAFLCCDDAEYIVGQTIVADGGTTALMSLMPDFRKESGLHFGTGYLPGV